MYFICVKYTELLHAVTALLSFSGAGASQRHIALYHILKALFFRVIFIPVDPLPFFFFLFSNGDRDPILTVHELKQSFGAVHRNILSVWQIQLQQDQSNGRGLLRRMELPLPLFQALNVTSLAWLCSYPTQW